MNRISAGRFRRWKLLILLALLTPLAACDDCISNLCDSPILSAVDLSTFDAVGDRKEWKFSEIEPFTSFDHWRLVDYFARGRSEVVATGGAKEASELTEEERELLELPPLGCPVAGTYCGQRFITLSDGEVREWGVVEQVRQFFGRIQSPVEAKILASFHDYGFSSDKENGAIKEVGRGFFLLATRTVSYCPVERKRFLLGIGRDGALEVVAEDVIERQEGTCIVF